MKFIRLNYDKWIGELPDIISNLVDKYHTRVDVMTHCIKKDIVEIVSKYTKRNKVVFYRDVAFNYYCVLYFRNNITIYYTRDYDYFEGEKKITKFSYFKSKIKRKIEKIIKEKLNVETNEDRSEYI